MINQSASIDQQALGKQTKGRHPERCRKDVLGSVKPVDRKPFERVYELFRDPEEMRSRWESRQSSGQRPWLGNEYSPETSYGRHRGPAPGSTHRAAVIAAILPYQDRWVIPLTLRPSNLPDHAGQVSLPGGRREGKESSIETACREMSEELGCTTNDLVIAGELPSLYVYASRHSVAPIVAIGTSFPSMNPCLTEVDKVLLLPVDRLLEQEPEDRELTRGSMRFSAPGMWVEGCWVWGATAMILGQIRETLQRLA